MEQLVEYSKELVDRFIRSMGYDPNHVDKDKRMAFTKTLRFQQFAQRIGEETSIDEQSPDSPKMSNVPYSKSFAQTRAHTKDMSLKRSVHVNKPQLPVATESVNISKTANLIKSIYKEHRLKEEIYDHEKDDKDGTTYGKKPKYASNKSEDDQVGDKKTQAAAVLSGGTTLTGQERDIVEIDPLLKKGKPGSPNGEVGDSKQ